MSKLEHIVRRMSKHELEEMFDQESIKRLPVMNSLDCVSFLNEAVARTYDGLYVSFGVVETDIESIVYGLICAEKIWLTNQKVTTRLMLDATMNPEKYGILGEDFTEDDIPMMFRKNNHVNGQSKLLCNDLEVMTIVAESDKDTVNMAVFGSSSQNYNAGSSYHVSAYLLSLMNLKKVNVSLFDYFETSHQYNIDNVSVMSYSTPCVDKTEYDVVIDDTWLPDKGVWDEKEYEGKIYNVKHFESSPRYLQPFFQDGLMREVRKTSYKWDYEYRGDCYFGSHLPCYECSYVENLTRRLIEAIKRRHNGEFAYGQKLKLILSSWIYRFMSKRSSPFMHYDYHPSMLNVFISAYKLRSFSLEDYITSGLQDRDIMTVRKYSEVSKEYFDDYGPEKRLYSKILYSRFDKKIRFASNITNKTYIDAYIARFPGAYLIMGAAFHTPSRYSEGHTALIEVDGNYDNLKVYRAMVRETSKRIVLISRGVMRDIPLDCFIYRKQYDEDYKGIKMVVYVAYCSVDPMKVYTGLRLSGLYECGITQFREVMKTHGMNPGDREYKRMLRYINRREKDEALEMGGVREWDHIQVMASIYEYSGDYGRMLSKHGYIHTIKRILENKPERTLVSSSIKEVVF